MSFKCYGLINFSCSFFLQRHVFFHKHQPFLLNENTISALGIQVMPTEGLLEVFKTSRFLVFSFTLKFKGILKNVILIENNQDMQKRHTQNSDFTGFHKENQLIGWFSSKGVWSRRSNKKISA